MEIRVSFTISWPIAHNFGSCTYINNMCKISLKFILKVTVASEWNWCYCNIWPKERCALFAVVGDLLLRVSLNNDRNLGLWVICSVVNFFLITVSSLSFILSRFLLLNFVVSQSLDAISFVYHLHHFLLNCFKITIHLQRETLWCVFRGKNHFR